MTVKACQCSLRPELLDALLLSHYLLLSLLLGLFLHLVCNLDVFVESDCLVVAEACKEKLYEEQASNPLLICHLQRLLVEADLPL